MITAIPMNEDKTTICMSFGRAPLFLIADTVKGSREFVVNAAAEDRGAAGIKAAQGLVDRNVGVLITPRCGGNAAEVLGKSGITIFRSTKEDAEESIEMYVNGGLSEITEFHPGFHGASGK